MILTEVNDGQPKPTPSHGQPQAGGVTTGEVASRFERLLPWIRSQFPAIESLRNGDRRVYLDNAAGTLVPRSVSEAMAEAATWANPQPGRCWPAGPETERRQRGARELLASFLNAPGNS